MWHCQVPVHSLSGSAQRDCHLDALEILGAPEAGQDEVAAAALAPPHALAGLAVPRLQAAVALPHLQARPPDRRPALAPATAPPRRPRQHPRLQTQRRIGSDNGHRQRTALQCNATPGCKRREAVGQITGISRELLCSAMPPPAANAEDRD